MRERCKLKKMQTEVAEKFQQIGKMYKQKRRRDRKKKSTSRFERWSISREVAEGETKIEKEREGEREPAVRVFSFIHHSSKEVPADSQQ